MEPGCLWSQMGESAPGILAEHLSTAPSGPLVPSATAPRARTVPLQLDLTAFEAEEPQGSAGLLPAAAAAPGLRETGGGRTPYQFTKRSSSSAWSGATEVSSFSTCPTSRSELAGIHVKP